MQDTWRNVDRLADSKVSSAHDDDQHKWSEMETVFWMDDYFKKFLR